MTGPSILTVLADVFSGRFSNETWFAWRACLAAIFGLPPENEGSVAEIRRTKDYEEATIRLAKNWREWTRESCGAVDNGDLAPAHSLDRAIAHELIHLVLADLERAGRCEFGELAMAVERRHDSEIDHQLERTVERLARVLVAAYDR